MNEMRILEIKDLLKTIPRGPWNFSEGSDFDHWEIWSSHPIDNVSLVQDDSGAPPDKDFINFILQARAIIEELLGEIEITNLNIQEALEEVERREAYEKKYDISPEMKAAGFRLREPDINSEKYKLAKEICKKKIDEV